MHITDVINAINCGSGVNCPKILDTDDPTSVVIQGDKITDPALLAELGLPENEAAVIVPRALLEGLV